MLIAIEHLPADIAAVLARQNGETVVALADGLSTVQIVAAENIVLNKEGAAVVVMLREMA